ncbi:MAG: phosphodiesterase [Chloroflexaceae bacterium]|nr:phosphodiesterase [Chloroflexaceae bacterium]
MENAAANFKFVPFEAIAEALPEFIELDPESFDPRNPTPNSLVNGVASGDTTQTSTVLWARSLFLGQVSFEISTAEDFSTLETTVTATVTDNAAPVKVEVEGLDPGTEYFYRVTDAAGDTDNGRFVTSAPLGQFNGLRFGATGDWQQSPPFPSLANADERELEFFIKLGDTIFADIETAALPGVTQARTLEEFRIKQAEIVTERFGQNTVRDLYATTSILATIDDHELVDNFAGGAAPGESPDAPDIGSSDEPLFTDDVDFVNDTQAYEDALQAFQEYHPIRDEFYGETGDPRTANERQLFRANTYGSDAAVIVLDSRSFRDVQLEPANLANPTEFLVEAFQPDRTLLGNAQFAELTASLLEAERSGITWKFVVIPEPIQNFGVVNAEDRFEGYAAERTALLRFIDENNIDNVVFLAGDFHGTIVNNLTYQLGPGQEQIATNAFEIVTGPAAFFDGLFGPTVVSLSAAFGLISQEEVAFFNSLPVANDGDSIVNDRDDFVKQIINSQNAAFGLDPVGLNDNLSNAEGLIDATLLQGDYVAVNTFGWTEFNIDAVTQQLRVTTYGVDAFSEADILANPEAITSLTPRVVAEFVVNPTLDPTNFFGTPGDDEFDVNTGDDFFGALDLIFTGAGSDLVDTSTSLVGGNRIYGGSGFDEVFTGISDRAFGGNGDDILDASAGEGSSRLYGGPGNDELVAGTSDRLFGNGGSDTFETSVGGGNNRLYGGTGDDFFSLGSSDRAIGGAGNDQFFVDAGGDNLITGGAGADQFWIATADLPDSANTITDFEAGVDVFGIGSGLGIAFADLTITSVDGNAQIATNGTTLALALGVQADSLTAANFVFG